MVPEAESQGMGIVVMRPLTSGTFQKWIRHIYPDVDRHVDLPRALLGYVLSNPLVDVAIVGMRSRRRVEANIAIAGSEARGSALVELHRWYLCREVERRTLPRASS